MAEYRFLNTGALREELMSATRETFAAFRQAVPDETLYTFALYTSGEAGYVIPSLNTEEGLTRKAEQYVEKHRYPNEPALIRTSLRWSPGDWAYHSWGEQFFTTSSERISQYQWIITPEEDGLDSYDLYPGAQPEQIYLTCLEALSDLNAEGLFGHGPERPIVTLLMGDQSHEQRVRWARLVNPPAVCERLRVELEDGLNAFHALSAMMRAAKNQ